MHDRQAVVNEMLQVAKDGRLPIGKITDLAEDYRVHRQTIGKIWKRVKVAMLIIFLGWYRC